LFVNLENKADEHVLLNIQVTASSISSGLGVAKAAYLAAACSDSTNCDDTQNESNQPGIKNYIMQPFEKVGVWMLCQGPAAWKTTMVITGSHAMVGDTHGGISGGSIAGIIIGSIVALVLILALGFFYIKY
jgi:hypothetical protein